MKKLALLFLIAVALATFPISAESVPVFGLGGNIADVVVITADGTACFDVNQADGTDVFTIDCDNGNVILEATGKIYLDGGVDTYIDESSADVYSLTVGGVIGMTVTESTSIDIDINGGVEIAEEVFWTSEISITYNSGTTIADWTDGNKQTMGFGAGNITTFAFTNPSGANNVILRMVQDGDGDRTVTNWDSDIYWPGGTIPTLSTGGDAEDIIGCYFNGTNYYCTSSLDFQ